MLVVKKLVAWVRLWTYGFLLISAAAVSFASRPAARRLYLLGKRVEP